MAIGGAWLATQPPLPDSLPYTVAIDTAPRPSGDDGVKSDATEIGRSGYSGTAATASQAGHDATGKLK